MFPDPRTSLEHRDDQRLIGSGLPGEHPTSPVTNVRAVQVQGDTPEKVGRRRLREACIGAGHAGLCALFTRLDAWGLIVRSR